MNLLFLINSVITNKIYIDKTSNKKILSNQMLILDKFRTASLSSFSLMALAYYHN